jgi:hypothetical protein
MKLLTGRKIANNTKILYLSQYLAIVTVVSCDLKLKSYLVGNGGEFDMFRQIVGEALTELLTKPLTGRKTGNNTKITYLLQYLSIDMVVFHDLKVVVYQGGDNG